jgi:carboxypeptidase Q
MGGGALREGAPRLSTPPRAAMLPRTLLRPAVVLLLTAPLSVLSAQDVVDPRMVERIRDEGLNRSQIAGLAGHLTDVIGPRLTGSTGMARANAWTADRFREWGLTGVEVAPWGEFGRGWEHEHYVGRILTPFVQQLHAIPVAWTGSTPGVVTGPAVVMDVSSAEEAQAFRGRLRGAWVLMAPPAEIGPEFDPAPRRFTEEQLRAPAAAAGAPTPAQMAQFQEMQRRMQLRQQLTDFFREEGVAGLLSPSGWTYGLIRLGGSAAGRRPGTPEPLPELMVAHEHYGQIWRNLGRGVPVQLEIGVRNRFLDDDPRGYNTLGEIRGSERPDEYVMIGAHLDSWHPGTGATDNAAGSVVMMEAMRILRAVGAEPRRTIRIALWSGEEQGLLGSRGWVAENRELWPRISAYLNIDNGTGRIRGIWNQQNEAATPIFETYLAPFRDLGVVAVRHGNTGGTDHLAFDAVGIPGFNFIQDPIEYSIRTHHSHVDTYERLVLDDLRQAAVIVAATAYHLAQRDEMMPRKAPVVQD